MLNNSLNAIDQRAADRARDQLATNKGQLARLLATENLTIVHNPNAKTACFDPKNRMLELPVWKDITPDLYDLFVVHEVAHALYTREDEWEPGIRALAAKYYPKKQQAAIPAIHRVVNVLEDPRVEKLIKRKYLGVARPMTNGYKQLWDRGFFQIEKMIEMYGSIGNVPFVDRINLYFKAGSQVIVPFSDEEKEIVDFIGKIETWQQLLEAAERVIDHIREQIQKQAQQQQEQDEQENEDDAEGDGEGTSKKNQKSKKKSKKGKQSTRPADFDDLEKDEQEKGKGKQKSKPSKGQEQNDDDADGEGDEGESDQDDGDQDGEEGQDGESDGKGQKNEKKGSKQKGSASDAGEAEGEGAEGNGEGDAETDGDADGEAEGSEGEGDGEPGDFDVVILENDIMEGSAKGGNRKNFGKGARAGQDIGQADTTAAEVGDPNDSADPANELATHTQEALNEGAATMVDTSTCVINCTVPNFDLKEIVHDYKKVMADHAKDIEVQLREYAGRSTQHNWQTPNAAVTNYFQEAVDKAKKWAADFRNSEKQKIAYMLKEFELRKAAVSASRVQVAKTGRLDMNKLHSYKTSDDLFKRTMTLNKGQSHGIFFIIDYSGSMSGTISKLLEQLTSLTLFCRFANIPFEVFLFTDAYCDPNKGYQRSSYNYNNRGANSIRSQDKGDLILEQSFWLRNILSSRMNLKEYNLAISNLKLMGDNMLRSDKMGGTPLLASILASTSMVEKFKTENKLDNISYVVMTDGDSNGIQGIQGTNWQEDAGYMAYGSRGKGKTYSKWMLTLKDKKTRRDFTREYRQMINDSTMSRGLCEMGLQLIQARTNCNLIGYYIADHGLNYVADRFMPLSKYTDQQRRDFSQSYKDKGYAAVKADGYDEYYIIHPNTLQTNQKEFANVAVAGQKTGTGDAKATFREFNKFTKARENSRQILRGFAARICAKDKENFGKGHG